MVRQRCGSKIARTAKSCGFARGKNWPSDPRGTIKTIGKDEIVVDYGGETKKYQLGDRLKTGKEKGGGGKGKKGFGGRS